MTERREMGDKREIEERMRKRKSEGRERGEKKEEMGERE